MIYRTRWLILGVVIITAVASAVVLGRSNYRRTLASRVVNDCRDRLRAEIDLGSSAEWKPGPGTLIRNMNGTYSTIAEVRMTDSRGRIVGVSAYCDYTPLPDSSFEHYSTRTEQSVLVEPDVPSGELSNLP